MKNDIPLRIFIAVLLIVTLLSLIFTGNSNLTHILILVLMALVIIYYTKFNNRRRDKNE
ncbi:hypothetical protein NST54_02035 [Caldifermentibacillus hisashii]|uniref:hypothetical protein n=1 Tax=Caldifermentibacillus hisashii TaxID=996558 RepID=UPI0034D574BF